MIPPLRAFRWRIASAMAAACVAGSVGAAEAPRGPASRAGTDPDARDASISYRVVIAAPSPLKEVLARGTGLARWQDYPEMTEELLERLIEEARNEARDAAAAEGSFSPDVRIEIDRATTPWTVTLSLLPGEPARVTAVRVEVRGPAATDSPAGTDAIAKLEREWRLPAGATFRQHEWSAAKKDALDTLRASPYAAARIVRSEAAIDPEQRTAELAVEIDSGPPFRVGPLEISGLAKYPTSIPRNFSTLRRGELYNARALEDYVWRLNASGYFASVQAAIDTEAPDPDDATVNVAVIEGPARRLEGGVGYSTDVQFRANASYRDHNLDGQGLQLLVETRVETKSQTGSIRLARPPNAAGWIGTFSTGGERTDIEGLVTRTSFVGTRWLSLGERDQYAVSANYYFDEQVQSGVPGQTSHALYPEVERHWRRVDNVFAPTEGWIAGVYAGGGVPAASSRTFGRLRGRFAAWIPIDRSNELQLRAEGGAVLADSRDDIPSTLLFRTGGDTTVRGYAFESLGVQQGDAVVPGRYYAVASVDAIHWMAPAWGIAAFVDAGNATDSLTDFRLALGYGIGGRLRTPIGPVRLDVAYGRDERKARVHFSVGLAF